MAAKTSGMVPVMPPLLLKVIDLRPVRLPMEGGLVPLNLTCSRDTAVIVGVASHVMPVRLQHSLDPGVQAVQPDDHVSYMSERGPLADGMSVHVMVVAAT